MMLVFGLLLFFQLLFLTGASEVSIVGGKVAKPHSRPYMVSLQVRGQHVCGGLLIREDFVLTAAHCENQDMRVVLGAHDITKKEKSQQLLCVEKFFPHPEYSKQKYVNDIMLIKLKSRATLNKYVKPIGLPKKNGKIPANIKCAVAGWGRTGANKPSSPVLRENTEKIQFPFECKNIWKEYFDVGRMLCTKFDKKKGGVCQGDSGGPLICNSKPQGITAFTYENDCNNSKYPHGFTKVQFYLPWIKEVMQGLGNVSSLAN